MYRIILMVLRSLFHVIYYLGWLEYYGKDKNKNYKEAYKVCRRLVKRAIKTGRIKVNVIGADNLPKEDGFLVTPNHQGLFDILVCVEGCDRPFNIVSKKEVENVILIKQVLKAFDGFSMDRNNLRQSMTIMKQVEEQLEAGRNFVIFPEGTRSKNGNNLLEFKGGTFKTAVKAKVPIVPCCMIDSYKAFDNKSIKRITVTVVYLEPLYYEEYKNMSTIEIAQEVQTRIQTRINNYTNIS
ncbi:MAG: lysophospholipid acyltransferase family protein [Eubacteriales bacterium]